MGKYYQPFDQRYNQREISRMRNLDPGSGPSLEEGVCDESPPTMEALTTSRGEPPTIGSVGTAPRGRKRMGNPSAGKDATTGV